MTSYPKITVCAWCPQEDDLPRGYKMTGTEDQNLQRAWVYATNQQIEMIGRSFYGDQQIEFTHGICPKCEKKL